MKKWILPLLVCLLPVIGMQAQDYVPTPVTVSKEKVKMNGKTYLSHIVLERQTLYSIARAYGVTVTDIDQANPALNLMKEGLKKNQILLIPLTGETGVPAEATPETVSQAEPSGTIPETVPVPVSVPGSGVQDDEYFFHTVKWFEDLSDIAERYHVSKEVLMKFNGMTSDKIKKRQKIKIPAFPDKLALIEAQPPQEPEQTEPVDTASVTPAAGQAGQTAPQQQDSVTAFSWMTGLFKSKNHVSLSLLLPFNTAGRVSDNYIDFYNGALMAVRDLGDKGLDIDLSVYDCAGGAMPLTADRFAQSDVVIGPVAPADLQQVLSAAPADRFIVSPLDPKAASLALAHENFVHMPTGTEYQHADVVNWILDEMEPGDKVILITEKGYAPTAVASYLQEAELEVTPLSYGILEGRNIVNTLNAMMTKTGTNRVVVASDHESFLVDVVRNLNLLVHLKNQVVLYSPSKIRSYDNTIDIENLHNVNLHVSTSYFVDYDDARTREFLPAYRALYRCEPTPFAFQGFDIITCMVNLCSRYGDGWPRMLTKKKEFGLQADFLFARQDNGGFTNEAIRRVVYKPDFSISIVR